MFGRPGFISETAYEISYNKGGPKNRNSCVFLLPDELNGNNFGNLALRTEFGGRKTSSQHRHEVLDTLPELLSYVTDSCFVHCRTEILYNYL